MHTHTNRPSPEPSSALAWIQKDDQGNRWVYYLLKSGEVSAGEQLTSTRADDHAPERNENQLMSTGLNCIWTGYCWFCP